MKKKMMMGKMRMKLMEKIIMRMMGRMMMKVMKVKMKLIPLKSKIKNHKISRNLR